ncbi:hypothetical protein HDE74_002164 [Janthinobacterium sp. K2Li3]|nr:hypothetical protein [Janthinobacterium sp. K2C7]MBB5381451.1 hypothetical protein [Janthinobacterium sp. K2Li3]MBB5387395.1 hypothetical protein [Janthinobacterium sp. K2E3]
MLLLATLCYRCVFCSEDKIIRGGGHSVNEDFGVFFKKVHFYVKNADFLLLGQINACFFSGYEVFCECSE